MKCIIKLLIFGMILMAPLRVFAGTLEEYATAQKIRVAAAACLASYDNPNGVVVSEIAKNDGWKIERLEKVADQAAIQQK